MKAPHQNVTFEQLIRKVQQAEDVLEARERRVAASYRHLTRTWREGWTPLRIVVAGLVSGFLVGRAEPLGSVGGARWLQMISAVSGLFASAQASVAAQQAENAADEAGQVAEAAGTDPPVLEEATRVIHQPRPAEAASELSES